MNQKAQDLPRKEEVYFLFLIDLYYKIYIKNYISFYYKYKKLYDERNMQCEFWNFGIIHNFVKETCLAVAINTSTFHLKKLL